MTTRPAPAGRPAAGDRSAAVHTWRRTTALRSSTLALVVGLAAGSADLRALAPVLVAALAVAASASVLDLPAAGAGRRWVPVVEGGAYALTLVAAGEQATTLLVLLALPTVVAGTRWGARATALTTLVTLLVALVAGAAGSGRAAVSTAGPEPATLVLWTLVGLGAGLLAAGQSRATRELTAAQAPLAAAHHLVVRLHDLVQHRSVELDVAGHTTGVQEEARRLARSATSSVWVAAPSGDAGAPALLASSGRPPHDEALAVQTLRTGRPQRRGASLALPLRIGDRVFGALVLGGTSAAPGPVQARVDTLAVGLETALLVEAVRAGATREERGRLSRDLHDGLAQRAVVLGYLADEVVDAATEPDGAPGAALDAAARLRAEAGSLVEDLRFSVFDLRTDLLDEVGLGGSLTAYVDDLALHSDLLVHLEVEERGPRLTRAAEAEVLRIAQEAVANVHRHAGADHLWLSLRRDGGDLALRVEDDGCGAVAPRPGHFGLDTMRERAERLGGHLAFGAGPRGGATVTLALRDGSTPTTTGLRPTTVPERTPR